MEEFKLTDYSKEVLKKFREAPAPNKEMMDQLKALPDEEVEMLREGYPSNVYVGSEAKRRGLEKGKK